MDVESFQDNGFVVVRKALNQDLVSFINDTWDQLKKPPYIEAFPYKVGKHILNHRGKHLFRIQILSQHLLVMPCM